MRKIKITAAAYMLALLLAIVTFVIFLLLKIAGVIAWSWWMVTSPIWAMAIIVLMTILFLFISLLFLSMSLRHRNYDRK